MHDILDETRIHSESYMMAYKVASDAVYERNEEDTFK